MTHKEFHELVGQIAGNRAFSTNIETTTHSPAASRPDSPRVVEVDYGAWIEKLGWFTASTPDEVFDEILARPKPPPEPPNLDAIGEPPAATVGGAA